MDYAELYSLIAPKKISPSPYEPNKKYISRQDYDTYVKIFYKMIDNNNIVTNDNVYLYRKLKKEGHTCMEIITDKALRYYQYESILPWNKNKIKVFSKLNFPQSPRSIRWCQKKNWCTHETQERLPY
ncbi:hypothetical protein BMW23_0118 [Bodo saltans virus]|uniref:Uncharacterized protein n=1 Tax=Bodo saltans virus TaxID=2024608 RepID=A0A2H4UTF6_9VIRU|nr:hypothetical protein QJ851_gp0115 [Bodo saltans virus]ATZ80178.1 hypothetical protein BMW23_0118 [Bodo saltans virus]